MKKLLKSVFVFAATATVVAGATVAAWTADTKVLGNTFSTGTAELQVWDGSEWVANKDGVEFTEVYPNWTEDYYVAVRNTGTVDLDMSVNAEWQGGWANWKDKARLQDEISVEVWEVKENGADSDWASSKYLGKYNTIRDWISRANGFPAAQVMEAESQQWYLFRFTATDLENEDQGSTLSHLNFVFDGTTEGIY